MKQIFTLSFMVMIFFSATIAQTVITYDNHAPQVGDSYTSTYLDVSEPVDPGNTGGGQTWDFSMFTGGETETMTFIDAATTLWGGQVNANLAIQSNYKGFFVAYFNATSDLVESVAMGSHDEEIGDNLTIFEDAQTMLQFPFAYGDTYEDTYSYTMEYTGMSMVFSGTTTCEADAWGNITTPTGVFNDVLRVKSVEVETTQTWVNGTLIDESTTTYTNYDWYAESGVGPVVSLEIDEDFPEEVSITFTETATGVSSFVENATIAWPNPANSSVTINTEVFSNGSTVMIVNNTGAIVREFEALNSEAVISLTNLEKGVYFVIGQNIHDKMIHEKLIIM